MKHLLSLPPNVVEHFHQLENKNKKKWFVASDPQGKNAGSGGGTAHILTACWKSESNNDFTNWLGKEDRIIIHGGGQSRRLPAYAPVGKILTPLPVFRWSRGQQLHQKLMDLQLSLLTKIIEKSPSCLNTLIASGDVLLLNEAILPKIPEADIVCVGLWTEPNQAKNHGVFFMERNNTDRLAFMLQKPDNEKIKGLMKDYDFLMDAGVWLLSDRAVHTLMTKSGWNNGKQMFSGNTPDFLDLYGDFGLKMGTRPAEKDKEINDLDVAVLVLNEAEFYHFGKSRELIDSCVMLQNRILDQREILHRRIKPHPSIFTLNTLTHINFNKENRNIWIENSHIGQNWKLRKNHIITGIPENDWHLDLPSGICLDIIPVQSGKYCLRPYGFSDIFRGGVKNGTTRWQGKALKKWFEKRNLDINTVLHENKDIQDAQLFPVLEKPELTENFIQWMIRDAPDHPAEAKKYINAPKLSASDILNQTNLKRLYEQRHHFTREIIPALARNHENSIFYQLDLKDLANHYLEADLPLPDEPDGKASGMNQIHDKMFRSKVLEYRGKDCSTQEQKAFEFLKDLMVDSEITQLVRPQLDLISDQIVWGRSPVRIDIAGGWTDTPPYCLINGGKVINFALNMNGQPPLQCFVKRGKRYSIVFRSIDLGIEEEVTTYEELNNFRDVGSAFAISKAALVLAGFSPAFCQKKYASLTEQLKDFGGGLEINTVAAVPKGSGLGTSSILAATILGTIADACNLGWDKVELGRKTLVLEQLLTTGGGWQDQFGGLLHGVKLIETAPGFEQNPVMKWLPDHLFHHTGLKSRMMIYYTGITRVAKNILAEIVRGMFLNEGRVLGILKDMQYHVHEAFETIQRGNYEDLGRILEESWRLNQQLDEGTNPPEIQKLLDKIDPWLSGKKLAGAGGGGFLFMVARNEDAAQKVKEMLKQNPPNSRARFVDFDLSDSGLRVTRS
ncbi:MAG: bifunctional fucokinase/fucose-1-phosphate guanylyltransferase [bacterium]